MDKINVRGGFLPGVLGRFQRKDSENTAVSEKENKMQPKAHPWANRLPNSVRNHFVAMAGEFVGTFMFLFLAFAGTQVANTPATTSGSQTTTIPQGPQPAILLYISLSFGFSLAVNAWIFFRVSGGLFNPAVTFALCLIGAVPFGRGALVFIAQMLGAICSAAVVSATFPGPLAVTTTLAGGTSKAQGVFIEMFLTAQLVFTIIMLAAEKHKGTFLAPVGIGLSLFIAELAGVYYTGGSLNPARSFGPCVANAEFLSDHWIYWVGPLLGALVASGFYWFIKGLEYQTANPGQDFDDLEAHAFDPETDNMRPVVSPNAVVDRSTSRDPEAGNFRASQSSNPTSPSRWRTTSDPRHENVFDTPSRSQGNPNSNARSGFTISNHNAPGQPPRMY